MHTLKFNKNLIAALVIGLFSGCGDDDDFSVPTFLEFQEYRDFNFTNLQHASGFLGSDKENALYIASRDSNPESGQSSERVMRLDLGTGEMQTSYFDQADFVTKELQIIGNQLFVCGGQYLNIYPLDLSDEPESIVHGETLSRFGSIVYNNEFYIWGGDLNLLYSDLIQKWTGQRFEVVAGLPTPKSWAHGEIRDDKIYIFGGQEQFSNTPPNDLIYVYDISENAIATLNLPEPVFRTFTAIDGPLIYVAGQIFDNPDDNSDPEIFFGAFDTRTFEFEEIDISLEGTGLETIHQIAVVDKQLFAIYGDASGPNISIMVTDLPK